MSATAYAVLFIDVTAAAPTIRGAGIFSEPHPSVDGKFRMAELFRVSAPTYAEAQDIAWQSLSSSAYAWTGVKKPGRHSRVIP